MLLAVILLLVGIAAVLLEFFIPAFGIVGLIGGASIIGSIVTAYRESSTLGSIFLIATLIIVPALIIIFFRVFPKTFFGKMLILKKDFKNDEGYTAAGSAETAGLEGKSGRALTDLRPSGTITVEGNKYSAVTSGEYIEKEKNIVIIKSEGSRIVVREDSL